MLKEVEEEKQVSVTMQYYKQSDPTTAHIKMNGCDYYDQYCPLCKRTAKWYYRFYKPKTELDSQYRCTLHPMSPIPGPGYAEDHEKAVQLY